MGAQATPALASDGVEPIPMPELTVPEPPPLPELDVDAMVPEPALVPELAEPPIALETNPVENEVEASVPVPGAPEQELPAPLEPPVDVISAMAEPDITTDPLTPAVPPVAAEPEAEDTSAGLPVLTPADNGLVSPENEIADAVLAAIAPEDTPTADAELAPEADELALIAEDPVRYHEGNMQYQLGDISDESPWVWDWYLVVDCSGIVTSISSEIGAPNSLDWTWNWVWDWTCGLDGASEENAAALEEGYDSIASVEVHTDEPGTTGGDAPAATSEPWLWTWTFSFCGHETTFSIQAGAQTSFSWTWNWVWDWACTSAPAAGGEGPSGTAADSGASTDASGLPPPLAVATVPLLRFETLTVSRSFATFVFVGPIPAVIPLAPSIAHTFPTGSGPERAPASGPGRRAAPAGIATFASTGVRPHGSDPVRSALPSPVHEERARPAKAHSREAAPPPARRLPWLPLGPSRRAAGGAPSSGGSAPSGGAATGVAALTGFVVLAAPGLGRRLRVARELSPRTRSEVPLDRPG